MLKDYCIPDISFAHPPQQLQQEEFLQRTYFALEKVRTKKKDNPKVVLFQSCNQKLI